MHSPVWTPLALVTTCLFLTAGNCGPTAPPSTTTDPEPTCALSCPYGLKHDLAGREFCECRSDEVCPSEGIAPFADPATGACLGFPTDCDIPAGWPPCGPCAADACGAPSPEQVPLTCGDGTQAGLFGCGRTELGTCEHSYAPCPEAECNTFDFLTCTTGFTCVDNDDDCHPGPGQPHCPGTCRTPSGGTSLPR